MCKFAFVFIFLALSNDLAQTQERAKDNGDVYLELEYKQPHETIKATTAATLDMLLDNSDDSEETTPNPSIDFGAIVMLCNASFSIPMEYIVKFNESAELPEIVDKTGMCFLRCFYEKSGLINNWQLNADLIRQNMWAATGDAIENCQREGMHEVNACVRSYAIAKCLTKHARADARGSNAEH